MVLRLFLAQSFACLVLSFYFRPRVLLVPRLSPDKEVIKTNRGADSLIFSVRRSLFNESFTKKQKKKNEIESKTFILYFTFTLPVWKLLKKNTFQHEDNILNRKQIFARTFRTINRDRKEKITNTLIFLPSPGNITNGLKSILKRVSLRRQKRKKIYRSLNTSL